MSAPALRGGQAPERAALRAGGPAAVAGPAL